MPRKKKAPSEKYFADFPANLRAIMEQRGTTQAELAEALGLSSRQAVGAYTNGQSSPDWKTLKQICTYFNVSADYLLGLTDVQAVAPDLRAVCEYTGRQAVISYDQSKHRFRERLNELFTSCNCTVVAFSEKCGITRQAMTNYLNGDNLPDFERLWKTAKTFNISTDYLLGLTDVQTVAPGLRAVCEYTGLSEETIKALIDFPEREKTTIDLMISGYAQKLYEKRKHDGRGLLHNQIGDDKNGLSTGKTFPSYQEQW